MIPCMIVPILKGPHILRQMLDTIDYPIKKLIIIDNGDALRYQGPWPVDHVQSTKVIKMPANLGVAGSWNLGIKAAPFAPWWTHWERRQAREAAPRTVVFGHWARQGLLDRPGGGDEGLTGDLATEDPLTVLVGRPATEQVHLDRFEIEESDQFVERVLHGPILPPAAPPEPA